MRLTWLKLAIGAITPVAGGVPAREMESARIEIEDLLRESRWLRRLAGHLVADPAEADDVAQQTYLAALASPPPGDREVRPWLSRVARNFIRSRYRADRRRRSREQAAAERAEVAAPDQLLEQVELQRLLAELVAELPEPYRAVIVMRFYRDRSAADIAAAEQVPAATIRWRIQRGLALLHAGLDRRHDGRADWRPALAGFARLPRPAPPGSGSAAMGPSAPVAAKLGLLAAAALAVCAIAALAIDLRGRAAPALAASTRRPGPQQAVALTSGARSIDGAPGVRRGVAGDANAGPGHAAPRDGRGDRVAGGPRESAGQSAGAEPRVTEMRLPMSSADVQGRLQELQPLFEECTRTAFERNPKLDGGAIFELVVVADPEVGAQVESAELLPVAGDPPDEELEECVRETSFSAELERPPWFVGRRVLYFPVILGRAAAEPSGEYGFGPTYWAVFQRIRQLQPGWH